MTESDTDWSALARNPALVAMLDLDVTTIPLTSSSSCRLDHGLVLLMDALHRTGVQIVVVTGRPKAFTDELRLQMPHVWWFPRPGGATAAVAMRELVDSVRARVLDARILAIGDDVDEVLFETLEPTDVSVTVLLGPSTPTGATITVAGASAVRALLWWIVEVRNGTRSDARPRLAAIRDGELEAQRRASLLVISGDLGFDASPHVALLEVSIRGLDALWLGWSGKAGALQDRPVIELGDTARATFDLPTGLRERFDLGFCQGTLRPVLHDLPPAHCCDEDWCAYITANEVYAKHATLLATPTSTVWVHGDRLMLVADAMRAYGHRGPIGLHLHGPFPALEQLELLPWSKELLARMRAFDVVGFETESWANNFARCLDAHQTDRHATARRPQVDVFPIGIDRSTLEGVQDASISRLRSTLGTRRLVLGVDRLEYLSGIPERLLAFAELLDQRPEWRHQVTLLQIVAPSDESRNHRELRHHIEGIVGRINGALGDTDWVPVTYLHRTYRRPVLAQLYRCADVALVTPLRAGFDLVAKEFAAAQDLERPGVLVLSRFAFGASELSDALLTNPHHTVGFAADIDRALRMPLEERQRRATALANTVVDEPSRRWAVRFLDRLVATRDDTAHRREA